MEVSIYRISFNFSDRVYIGQSANFENRTKQHETKIKRLSFCVQNEKRKQKDIMPDNKDGGFKAVRGFNFQMYLDALRFFRKTKTKPCIVKVEVIDSVGCECQSHKYNPCSRSLAIETEHAIKNWPNYNSRYHYE